MRNLFIIVRNDKCHTQQDYIRIRNTLWSSELKEYAKSHDLQPHLLLLLSHAYHIGATGLMPPDFLDHWASSPTSLQRNWAGCTVIDLCTTDEPPMTWDHFYDCAINCVVNMSYTSEDLVFIAQDDAYYDSRALVKLLAAAEHRSLDKFCLSPRFYYSMIELNDLKPYVDESQNGWGRSYSTLTEGSVFVLNKDPYLSLKETCVISTSGLLMSVKTLFKICDKTTLHVSDATFDYALERALTEKGYCFAVVEQAYATVKHMPYCIFLDSPKEIFRINTEQAGESFDGIILGLEAPDVDRIVRVIDEYLTITTMAERYNIARKQWASGNATPERDIRRFAQCISYLIEDSVFRPERKRYNKLRVDGIIEGLEQFFERRNKSKLTELFASLG